MGGNYSTVTETLPTLKSHKKALGPDYLGTETKKAQFDTQLIPWNVAFTGYTPVDYTASVVSAGPVWADPDVSKTKQHLNFNTKDGKVNRVSFMGVYDVNDCVPVNPIGRTGMKGRGLLGKWGPNHAADPIVTRWRKDNSGNTLMRDGKGIIEFVAIQRNDTGEWAIPGGMVDNGECVSITLKREFGEEAFNSLELSDKEKVQLKEQLDKLFKAGKKIYSGYVDDPRNTDNAWMETVAMNFHDDIGTTNRFKLKAGSDAGGVRWLTIDKKIPLFASHYDFIKQVCRVHNAYFED